MVYTQVIEKISKHHKVKTTQLNSKSDFSAIKNKFNHHNQSWQLNNEIWLGIFDNPEFGFLSFFHEMGHILDRSAWHLIKNATIYDQEKAAWNTGYKLAHKYGITFSKSAIEWGKLQLKTYKK